MSSALIHASAIVCVFMLFLQVISCQPTSEELAVINLHNGARAASGLAGLSFDMRLYNVSCRFPRILSVIFLVEARFTRMLKQRLYLLTQDYSYLLIRYFSLM